MVFLCHPSIPSAPRVPRESDRHVFILQCSLRASQRAVSKAKTQVLGGLAYIVPNPRQCHSSTATGVKKSLLKHEAKGFARNLIETGQFSVN